MPLSPNRPLLTSLFAILFAVSLPLLLPMQAPGAAETREWSDTSRDVYIDGELDASVIALVADDDQGDSELALVSKSLGRAYVLSLESLELRDLPLSGFTFNGTGAVSGKVDSKVVARASRFGDGRSTFYLATLDDHTVVIASHRGLSGPTDREELFAAVPSWQRRAQAYEPESDAVETLRAVDRDVEVTVALGTWCGDSRNYVPKLLKTLEQAGNPHIKLDLMAIYRGFNQPADFIRGERITNVPTIIVREAGTETGRVVETPGGGSVETDVAAILSGSPEPHRGRWSREEEIAHGRYAYRDVDNASLGSETWEWFNTEGGGRLLHSIVESGSEKVEIWHRLDPEGASVFAELTRHQGGELSRTRIWIDDGTLRSVTRGNATGIVEQKLDVPAGTNLLLPGAAAAGSVGGESATLGFLIPLEQPAAGRLVEMHSAAQGLETVVTRVGEIEARRLETTYSNVRSRLWLDATHGFAVRGTVPDLGEVVLEELTVASQMASAH